MYNIHMKEITNYDLRNDEVLHKFFYEAYINNQGVMIPAELLKDFVEMGCRMSIAKNTPFCK